MLGPNKALKLAPTNIHEILERVGTLLEAESKGRLNFERDYDPSIPEFKGDKEQLIQAFLNIARNAGRRPSKTRAVTALKSLRPLPSAPAPCVSSPLATAATNWCVGST